MILKLIREAQTDALENENSDAGRIEIQGYLPETVLSLNELDPSSNITDGDIDA